MPRRRQDVGEVPLQLENRIRRPAGSALVTRCTSLGTNCTLASPTGKEAVYESDSHNSAGGFGAEAGHFGDTASESVQFGNAARNSTGIFRDLNAKLYIFRALEGGAPDGSHVVSRRLQPMPPILAV